MVMTTRKSTKKLKLSPSSFQLYDLNDDCLIQLFGYLDLISLANMCITCKRFHRIIMSHIIPFRTIDFGSCDSTCSVRKMFALFGKSMTRICVHQDLFARQADPELHEFLCMLIKYGQPGKLKAVTLLFDDYYHSVPANVIGPYFANVHKLEFSFITYQMVPDDDVIEFITAIDTRNVRELRVNNHVLVGEWFTAESFPSVQKLCLHFHQIGLRFHAENERRLAQFISNKPASLIDFQCSGVPSDELFVELSRQNPNIEQVGGIDDNHGDVGLSGVHSKWNYFNAFANLKGVNLESTTADFSDFGEVFRILAKQQTIEQLQLFFGPDNDRRGSHPVRAIDLKRLTQLKTLQLLRFNDNRSREFVSTLFANLPALTTCTIIGKPPIQGRIIELIKLAPSLKVLKFDNTHKFHTFSVPFYDKLIKCRASPEGQVAGHGNRLVIFIDRDSANTCMEILRKLNKYKPNIIMLRSL